MVDFNSGLPCSLEGVLGPETWIGVKASTFWSSLEVWIFHVSTAWFIVYVGVSQMAAPQFLLVYNGKYDYNG